MDNLKKINSFQNRLKETMNERHINQTELSKRTNIKRTSINGYYVGDAEPNAEKILILSLELGVEPLWLLGYDTPKNKEVGVRKDINSFLDKMNEKQLNIIKEISKTILEAN
jgi:transcriptional regulator with XRE-family HTH domain